MKTYLGYHFVGDTLRDGRPIPPDGEWLVHDGVLKLCKSGLHWSTHPFDALLYAPGPTLCLVECDGKTIFDCDKAVSQRRKIIKRIDATQLLRGFARWQAYQVMHLWDAPEIVRLYIQTWDEALRAAAWGAALTSARASALTSARAAAWEAARAAAREAAREDFGFLVDSEFRK